MNKEAKELPAAWTRATLGDLGEYYNGRGFKKSEWAESGRPIIRIQNLTNPLRSFNHFEGTVDPRIEVSDGDVLVSWAATLDVFRWRGPKAVLNQHIFRVASFISEDFHYYLLKYVLNELRAQAHGSGIVHITRGRFLNSMVSLPPRAEQDRIASTIDELFQQVEEAREASRRASEHVVLERDAIYTHAVRGPWPIVELGELLSEPLRNGHSARASQDRAGVRTLTLTAVTTGRFTESNTKVTNANPARVKNLWLEDGDIFVERSNTPELVGTAALYRGDSGWAIFPDLLIRVRVADSVLPEYLEVVLKGRSARHYFQEAAQGIAGSMPKISQDTILGLQVPLPALEEQRRIVSDVHRRINVVNQAVADINCAEVLSSELRRSTLQHAFSGKLIPQDPSDEPAAALLERVRAQREEREKMRGVRRRVGRTTRSAATSGGMQ